MSARKFDMKLHGVRAKHHFFHSMVVGSLVVGSMVHFWFLLKHLMAKKDQLCFSQRFCSVMNVND